MKATLLLAVLILTTLTIATPLVSAQTETYYVATTGHDTWGDGTETWVDTDLDTVWSEDDTGPWLTITHAITEVEATDTINVAAGTYTEGKIVISKDLTIIGDPNDKPVINPTEDFTVTGASGAWFLVEEGFSFDLSNVVIDGDTFLVHQAIRSHGDTTITNVDFRNIQGSTSGNPYSGFAVSSYGGEVESGIGAGTYSASHLIVTDSTFEQIGRVGVIVKGKLSTVEIVGCTYTGKGTGDWLDYGFEISAGASATIEDNTIAGNIGVALVDGSTSAGIYVTDYHGTGTSATITGNTISGTTRAIRVGYQPTAVDASDVVAHYNNLVGNEFGVTSTLPQVDATLNYWGSPAGPSKFGLGDDVSELVTYSPWLLVSQEDADVDDEMTSHPQLDKKYYRIDDTVLVTEYDGMANDDPMALEELWVWAYSGYDVVGDIVYLTETGSNTGVFEGSFTVIGAPPADREANEIVIDDEDTITVDYTADQTQEPVLGDIFTIAEVDMVKPLFDVLDAFDEDFYSNTQEMTLELNFDGDTDLKVSADFSVIDSEVTLLPLPIDSPYTLTHILDVLNTRADGLYTITVTAEDLAGNTATHDFTATLDNTMPSVTYANAVPVVIQPAASTPVTFTVTVSDEFSLVASVMIDLSAISESSTQVMTELLDEFDVGTGVYEVASAEYTVALPGDYDLPITATDTVGNENALEAITLKVIADLNPPVFVSADVTYPVGVVSARIGDPVLVTVVATDDLSEVETIIIDALDIGLSESEDMTLDVDTWTATLTVGTVIPGTYELTLTATDFAKNTETETVTVEVTTDITGLYVELEEGWNMFSLPLIPDDSSIEVVLADVMENVESVWSYDEGWSTYNPAMPMISTLTDLVDGTGYWVKMTATDTVTVSGVELPDPGSLLPVYDVVEGWNLIGFKSVDEMTIPGYLTTIPNTVLESSVCYGWDATSQAYDMVSLGLPTTDDMFFPGEGYWLYLTEDASIAPPTQDPLV